MVAGTSEVIAVCQSLQQVAEKCQQDPESCWYFHQTAVPCLLALAVQASMPGNFLHPAPSLSLVWTSAFHYWRTALPLGGYHWHYILYQQRLLLNPWSPK